MIASEDARFFVRLAGALLVLVPSMCLAAFVSLWWLPAVLAGGAGVFFSVPRP